jgi:hypothetical protein
MRIISAADDAVHANDEVLITASAMPINLSNDADLPESSCECLISARMRQTILIDS